jgi:VIT1/CCC1 family predicted Fe2+/Mn2+ transporter
VSRAVLLRPAVFGAFDGLTAVLGLLLSLRGHPSWVLPSALGLAVAEGVGMAAGQWLSSDSDAGFAASGVIGAATAAGSLAPAVPFALLPMSWAALVSAVVLVAIGAGIAAVRSRDRGWPRALAETFGVLAAAVVAVGVCITVTPGGAA